jgi:D-alanine-D-alanine ligase
MVDTMSSPDRLKVAVLLGGDSAEREVSLGTGGQILAALPQHKYEAWPVDAAGELMSLMKRRPDVVFIALHGPGGEDGSVQGFLEMLRLPYTGSGVLASALAMDKAKFKRLLHVEGIPTPWARCMRAGDVEGLPRDLPYPLVVKPNRQGSSFGMTIVQGLGQVEGAVREALRYDDEVLLEEYAGGVEITVACLGNRCPQALPSIEIIPTGEYYDYASKYEAGGSRHVIPARISETAADHAARYARRCHLLLGCSGMSRTDMMVDGDDVVVLELNTIPGMTPTSLLPEAAAAAGIPFPVLLDRLIADALSKD